MVLAPFLTGAAFGIELVLDFLPGGVVNQGFVLPVRVLDALVAHPAFVIRMPEKSVEVRHHQRLGRRLRSWGGGQTSLSEFFEQVSDGPVAARVGLEREAHQRPTLRVDVDRSDFPAVDHLPDIHIATGCLADRPTSFGFLDRSLDDLARQVP